MDIKFFDGIAPKQIDKTVEKFCKTVKYGSVPKYVKVCPWSEAIINECVPNVNNYLKTNEGKVLTGWAVWLHPMCMIEAEFHVIYQDKNGVLIDITPHKGNPDKILFLEDNTIIYNGCQINSIRKNISKSKLIDKFINNQNRVFEITNKGKLKHNNGEIRLPKENFKTLLLIQEENTAYLKEFYSTLKLKPNDSCICGSGLKFIDCCKYNI